MNHVIKLTSLVKPYWRRALVALVLLTAIVFMDLAIPRLIQRIIDQGITQRNQAVIIQASLWMLGISALSTIFAVGNNVFSVQVGESAARDLRDALFVQNVPWPACYPISVPSSWFWAWCSSLSCSTPCWDWSVPT